MVQYYSGALALVPLLYFDRFGSRFSCWSCATMSPLTVWFHRNWYWPAKDDTSCYLVDTFAPGISAVA